MEEKKFQKKNLNRNDHKKVDKVAKGARIGTEIIGAIAVIGGIGYKVLKAAGKFPKA